MGLRRVLAAGRRNELAWRYAYNLAPSLGFRRERQALPAESERVLRDLNARGIAITSAEAFLGTASLYSEMEAAVRRLESEMSPELERARLLANDQNAESEKSFIYQLLGEYPKLDVTSIFGRFALQESVLRVVNAYFGMYTRLRHYNVWHTFVTSAEPRQSQLWHYDREDRMILKLFVYMDDVDEQTGPFTYAPGTHQKGPVRQQPGYTNEKGVRRSSDQQMAAVVPASQWIRATGPKGTMVFADTRGYHKGGLARGRDRIMYTCMFTSPASESRELLARPAQTVSFADQARRVALAPPRPRFWLNLP